MVGKFPFSLVGDTPMPLEPRPQAGPAAVTGLRSWGCRRLSQPALLRRCARPEIIPFSLVGTLAFLRRYVSAEVIPFSLVGTSSSAGRYVSPEVIAFSLVGTLALLRRYATPEVIPFSLVGTPSSAGASRAPTGADRC